jgi:hypothetical protein
MQLGKQTPFLNSGDASIAGQKTARNQILPAKVKPGNQYAYPTEKLF